MRPFFPAGIQELEGSVCTPLGLLSIRAVRRSGGAEFSVTVPEGMLVRFSYGRTEAVLAGGIHSLAAEE